jgi:hypothetical protein
MQAGLTAQEDAVLKAIAADWRAGDAGIVRPPSYRRLRFSASSW